MIARRKLLASAGLAATGLLGATACLKSPPSARNGAVEPVVKAYAPAAAPAQVAPAPVIPAPAAPVAADPHAGMTMTPNPAISALSKADEMDRHHEAGIKAFPAKTAAYGNQRLQPRLEDGVKVFEVTAQRIKLGRCSVWAGQTT